MSRPKYSVKDTHALIIGIEKYEEGFALDVPGAVQSALEFESWLVGRGVLVDNIKKLLSSIPERLPTFDNVRQAVEDLRSQGGGVLFFYWAGHGALIQKKRALFFSNSEKAQYTLSLDSLPCRLQSGSTESFPLFFGFVDACANVVDAKCQYSPYEFADDVDGDKQRYQEFVSEKERYLFFAVRTGQVADFEGIGIFTRELLDELKDWAFPLDQSDFDRLDFAVASRLESLGRRRPEIYCHLNGRGVVAERQPSYAGDSRWVRTRRKSGAELMTSINGLRFDQGGGLCLGRETEIKALDAAWQDPGTNIISIVAWGGVGKSTLVNHWLGKLAKQEFDGAERVYGWSFYKQGTRDEVVSADELVVSVDEFIQHALGSFGDPDPSAGTTQQKGERLASLLQAHRTLLVLDGLEPLQYALGEREGRLKDPQLQALLPELAARNPGLCVITTRLPVSDLDGFKQTTVQQLNLRQFNAEAGLEEAGVEVLRTLGVKGADEELRLAVESFGGHALALTLLGTLLKEQYGGDVRNWREVGPLTEQERLGGHARRVMAAYAKWFCDRPELAVLYILGLFDRPANQAAVMTLRTAPVIVGLTESLVLLKERQWQQLLSNLRRLHLLAAQLDNELDAVDAHPLVREFFGQQLRNQNESAWREAHSRLFEYFTKNVEELPTTLSQMSVLFQAIYHGCLAGRYKEALNDIYWQRVLQDHAYYSTDKLGAYGAGLAALSGFFESRWDQPVADLDWSDSSLVFHESAVHLIGVGRLIEAQAPLRAALKIRKSNNDFANAALTARYLGELGTVLGNLRDALSYAEDGVYLADIAKDHFERMAERTVKGQILVYLGHLTDAAITFAEAEQILDEDGKPIPNRFFFWGLGRCELLIAQGKHEEAVHRGLKVLELAAETQGSPLANAQIHLAIGRGLSAALQTTDSSRIANEALTHLDYAVDHFREAHHDVHLPRGLLARAELRIQIHKLVAAQDDLDKALSIAEPGRMARYQADCHLQYACLHLSADHREKAYESVKHASAFAAQGPFALCQADCDLVYSRLYRARNDREKATAYLRRARDSISRIGYLRRSAEVAELDARSA